MRFSFINILLINKAPSPINNSSSNENESKTFLLIKQDEISA